MEIDCLRNNVGWNACPMDVYAVAYNGFRRLDLFDRACIFKLYVHKIPGSA